VLEEANKHGTTFGERTLQRTEAGQEIYVDQALVDLRKVQGFDKKPSVATPAELDEMVANKTATHVARGEKMETFSDDLLHGEFYPAQGIFGNGQYFGHVDNIDELGEAIRTALSYAGPEGRTVVRGALKQSAKTIEHDAIFAIQTELHAAVGDISFDIGMAVRFEEAIPSVIKETIEGALNALDETLALLRQGNAAKHVPDNAWGLRELLVKETEEAFASGSISRLKAMETLLSDRGYTATALGYDAIAVAESGVDYVVLLNRDAVVFAEAITRDAGSALIAASL
jgi:hypothetical protein